MHLPCHPQNPLLWSLLVALLVNLSGLRSVLWAGSAHYRPELGWVAGSLAWVSGITVPVSLFSNGVWLHGKSFGRPTMLRVRGGMHACTPNTVAGGMCWTLFSCAIACRLRVHPWRVQHGKRHGHGLGLRSLLGRSHPRRVRGGLPA